MQKPTVSCAAGPLGISLFLMANPVAQAEPNLRLMKINHYSAKADAGYKAEEYAEAVRYFQMVDRLRPFDASANEASEVAGKMSNAGLEVKRVEIVALAHEIPADYLEHENAAISFALGE